MSIFLEKILPYPFLLPHPPFHYTTFQLTKLKNIIFLSTKKEPHLNAVLPLK